MHRERIHNVDWLHHEEAVYGDDRCFVLYSRLTCANRSISSRSGYTELLFFPARCLGYFFPRGKDPCVLSLDQALPAQTHAADKHSLVYPEVIHMPDSGPAQSVLQTQSVCHEHRHCKPNIFPRS